VVTRANQTLVRSCFAQIPSRLYPVPLSILRVSNCIQLVFTHFPPFLLSRPASSDVSQDLFNPQDRSSSSPRAQSTHQALLVFDPSIPHFSLDLCVRSHTSASIPSISTHAASLVSHPSTLHLCCASRPRPTAFRAPPRSAHDTSTPEPLATVRSMPAEPAILMGSCALVHRVARAGHRRGRPGWWARGSWQDTRASEMDSYHASRNMIVGDPKHTKGGHISHGTRFIRCG
jgi:hypothetical protein